VEGADTETSHEIMVEIQVDFVPADCVAKLVWPSESGGLEFTVFAHMTYHTRAPVAVHTQLSYVCLVTTHVQINLSNGLAQAGGEARMGPGPPSESLPMTSCLP